MNKKNILGYSFIVLLSGLILSGCALDPRSWLNTEESDLKMEDSSYMQEDSEVGAMNDSYTVSEEEIAMIDGVYSVLPESSQIGWSASKTLVRTSDHFGVVAVKSGEISVENGELVAGTIVADMTSITSTDLTGAMKEKLDGHLASDDFFSIESHPEAIIQILSAQAIEGNVGSYLVDGEMTIKGITNPVQFNAMLARVSEDSILAQAEINIDRTLWDIRFGSAKFFDNLGDNVINDEFTLEVGLTLSNK